MKNLIGVLILCVGGSAALSRAEESSPPNIVFLFADDQRADTIAAHGNNHIQTPSLDRLTREGVSCQQNYCAGSYSGAVCVASRSMIMTGRHWMRIDDTRNWTGLPLLPEVLGENGYATHAVGKWHNGRPTLARGFQSGKAIMMGGMCDHTEVPLQDLTREGALTNSRVGDGFSSTLFADAAIDYLTTHGKASEPFFLYVAFTAPHDPRNPPESVRQVYYDNPPPLPENFLPQHPFDNGQVSGKGRDESLADWPRQPEVIRDQLCEYYGLITHLDKQVGRILDAIDTLGFGENTIVVYAADHGLALGSHGLLGKQNVYEHSMTCPLVVRGPGIPVNTSTTAMTYLLDLYRTLCGYAGVDVPEGVDGCDLRPVFEDTNESVRESVFLAYQDKMRTVRDNTLKLHVYPAINYRLLFDLEADPLEMMNLAENPERAEDVDRLLGEMKRWQKRLGDTLPLSVEDPKPKEINLTGRPRVPDRWQPKWIRDKYFGGRDAPVAVPATNKKRNAQK
ncbi:MAG: sulfatase-like hydrolase/transferase [Pirellulales bacterium]|nr:sulfatase-like hydrolase/transferase [Pirellulales bacterium]